MPWPELTFTAVGSSRTSRRIRSQSKKTDFPNSRLGSAYNERKADEPIPGCPTILTTSPLSLFAHRTTCSASLYSERSRIFPPGNDKAQRVSSGDITSEH